MITGATAGIGEAFALHYAKAGVTLALTGRNKTRLDEVARACEARCAGAARGARTPCAAAARRLTRSASTRAREPCSGATVKKGNLDVTDREGMEKFLLSVDKAAPVECARGCAAPRRAAPQPLTRSPPAARAQLHHRERGHLGGDGVSGARG